MFLAAVLGVVKIALLIIALLFFFFTLAAYFWNATFLTAWAVEYYPLVKSLSINFLTADMPRTSYGGVADYNLLLNGTVFLALHFAVEALEGYVGKRS